MWVSSFTVMSSASKTWLVGLDGSHISYRALRLATMMMDPNVDTVKAFTIYDPSTDDVGTAQTLMSNAELELRKAHVPSEQWVVEAQALCDGWNIANQIIYHANHVNNGNAVLVIGASGKTADGDSGKVHPSGNPPMGKIADACLNRCKVPVLLTRASAAALDEQEGVTRRRGLGGEAKGLCFTVCVDQSNLSKKAFDLSLRLCRPMETDMLRALHVEDGEWMGSRPPPQRETLRKYYEAECHKASFVCDDLIAGLDMVPRGSKASIKDTLLSQLEKTDVVVIGSMELSNFDKKIHLGSVAQAVAKLSRPHVLVVKNYTST